MRNYAILFVVLLCVRAHWQRPESSGPVEDDDWESSSFAPPNHRSSHGFPAEWSIYGFDESCVYDYQEYCPNSRRFNEVYECLSQNSDYISESCRNTLGFQTTTEESIISESNDSDDVVDIEDLQVLITQYESQLYQLNVLLEQIRNIANNLRYELPNNPNTGNVRDEDSYYYGGDSYDYHHGSYNGDSEHEQFNCELPYDDDRRHHFGHHFGLVYVVAHTVVFGLVFALAIGLVKRILCRCCKRRSSGCFVGSKRNDGSERAEVHVRYGDPEYRVLSSGDSLHNSPRNKTCEGESTIL